MIFNASDIARNFDDRDNSRGRALQTQGKVRDLRVERNGGIIFATVQGEAAKNHQVEIEIKKKAGFIQILSHCNCATGYMCEHGCAALHEAISAENRKLEGFGGGKTAKTKEPDISFKVQKWLAEMENTTEAVATGESRIVYFLPEEMNAALVQLTVTPALQHKLRDGNWGQARPQSFHQIQLLGQHDASVTESDRALATLAQMSAHGNVRAQTSWIPPEEPDFVDLFLRRVIATGRAFCGETSLAPLTLGEPLEAELGWSLQKDGHQAPSYILPRAGMLAFMSASPWYMDPVTRCAGPLRTLQTSKQVKHFLSLGPINDKEASLVREKIEKAKSKAPAPLRIKRVQEIADKPQAVLELVKVPSIEGETDSIAFLRFAYGRFDVHPLDPADKDVQETAGGEVFLKKRNLAAEKSVLARLSELDMTPHPLYTPPLGTRMDPRGHAFVPLPDASPWFWQDFLQDTAPLLKAEGFDIRVAPDFEGEIISPDVEDIDADLTQSGDWWFSLDLGIVVGGQRLPLLPILVAMLRRLRSTADVDRLTESGKCYAPLPDGRQIALPAARIRTILKTLVELFEEKPLDKDGNLRVSMDLAAAFVKLEAITSKRWLGEGHLRQLVEKLNDFEGIVKQDLPKGMQAKLRTYQQDGYNWLHFLRDYSLSGILADDMGLGKTIQTLTYILSLKERGELKAPALIIMPTSLVANWQSEAARFTPDLKILTLHGKDRAVSYNAIKKSDLVLTTYPLLPRDGAKLKEVQWSLIALDEAQAIKNPSAKMTQAACALQAKQRLCLTGTPVENHLGEAWSLFTFLMPGLLGDNKKFTRTYRTPIEKGGDGERKVLLARRLRPFVLRRLKNEVEKELPPKTEIIRRVTLTDEQRDLYEAVRHVMNDRVREEIDSKGFGRSQIVILDALLKLRQTCCDPRLVKLEAARKVRESAKLDELMEMLPTLIEDGRRVLLFSQFTSMLDLIVPELEKVGIPYVELRGTTKDRSTPIRRFQDGEVPLFLISLKAGGTGLNLTTADTVIHYDPWWNPSVENQATDRAHRIGQTKPVFVYKLIAEGTVEERILELQSKKAGLAAALFGDKPDAAAALTPDDLQWLMG